MPLLKHYFAKNLLVVLLALTILALAACSQQSSSYTKIEPAKVEAIEGSDLKRLILTERAIERLDVQTVPVLEKTVLRKRTLSGEVVESNNGDQRVWVRLRLTESEYDAVHPSEPATVMPLEQTNGTGWTAHPVSISSQTDSVASELYYALEGSEHGFLIGDAVLADISLRSDGPHKIIPYSAVIYGLHGETWAYTSPELRTFVRQEIVVDYIDGDLAYLLKGPSAGTHVVSVAAAELWGEEFGVGK